MTTSASEVSVCSHLFTVKGYTHTRGIGVGIAIESPAFDAAGHRWSVVFYPDGDDQDSRGHISVYIRRVGGTGDATVLYGFSLVDPTGAASAPEASKAPKIASFGRSAGGESRASAVSWSTKGSKRLRTCETTASPSSVSSAPSRGPARRRCLWRPRSCSTISTDLWWTSAVRRAPCPMSTEEIIAALLLREQVNHQQDK
ncbi:unnamed protein product [Miscanthus lutarioriparius]|uniref:MATH domain-containing protein n=1 Tax=Miscanthus lutarioriparius TaxID=422564 RepID=A0A811QSQ6_9POAL|nr:unnamed protein product [Miscanthus lutarioriparius]